MTTEHKCECYICRASQAITLLKARPDLTDDEIAALAELANYMENTIEEGESRDGDIYHLALLVGIDKLTGDVVKEIARRNEELKAAEEALARADDERASASAQAARLWRTNNKLAADMIELEAQLAAALARIADLEASQ